jgi:hypothetical protein
MADQDLRGAVERMAGFLGRSDVCGTIRDLERDLTRADLPSAMQTAAVLGIDEDMLISAMRVRRDLARLNDVVHATAILLSLPALMEPDEVIQRPPSLAAANDRTRRFDLETNRRLAEFRLAVWDGADAGRQRGLVKDLAHLALHDPEDERLRQLFVVGQRPLMYLRNSRSRLRWALDRGARVTTDLVAARVDLDTPLCEFVREQAANVELIDLCERMPQIGHTIEVIDMDTVSSDVL